MNFLGHSYLSFNNQSLLVGNIIGDFVKGTSKNWEIFPTEIQAGIKLHREIDSFTDQHEAIKAAKSLFRAQYGLYSGVLVDILMDYFLANDSQLFSSQAQLQTFCNNVYNTLNHNEEYLPAKFIPYYESMILHNWLYLFHTKEGVSKALQAVHRRVPQMGDWNEAFRLFEKHELTLNTYYADFIESIILFVKNKIELIQNT